MYTIHCYIKHILDTINTTWLFYSKWVSVMSFCIVLIETWFYTILRIFQTQLCIFLPPVEISNCVFSKWLICDPINYILLFEDIVFPPERNFSFNWKVQMPLIFRYTNLNTYIINNYVYAYSIIGDGYSILQNRKKKYVIILDLLTLYTNILKPFIYK